jgi:hypothetical protein
MTSHELDGSCGDVDELECVQVPVGVVDDVRRPGQQSLAVVQACQNQQWTLVRVAARRDVGEGVRPVRIAPPSELSKICVGLDGLTMIAC